MSIATIDKEREDLDTHVSLCAERYQQLDTRLSSLEHRLTVVEDKIDRTKVTVVSGLIATGGSIIVALITGVTIILSNING